MGQQLMQTEVAAAVEAEEMSTAVAEPEEMAAAVAEAGEMAAVAHEELEAEVKAKRVAAAAA